MNKFYVIFIIDLLHAKFVMPLPKQINSTELS